MQTSILTSTAFLTLLLAAGLFFFIRASAKDRTEVARLVAEQPEEALLEQLQNYFVQRAYQLKAVDAAKNQVTFEGAVRPSLFLAIFLSLLAAIGIFCLLLVVSFLVPDGGNWLFLLVLFAPAAGLFYWRRAGRLEQVLLRVNPLAEEGHPKSLLTVTAHRDELAELRQALELRELPE
jgi:Flp pilus assembly protein TadB